MNSRFVNLLVRSCNGGSRPFSLHRINPANLFYRIMPEVPEPMADAPLPPAFISFDRPCRKGEIGWMDFMTFGRSRNKFVAVDDMGKTFFYNPDSRIFRTGMPRMCSPIRDPISIAVGDSLYVMSGNPGPRPKKHCFQALIHGRLPDIYSDIEDWCWYSLQPPPPFVDDNPSCHDHELKSSCCNFPTPFAIGAYTVVGDSQIWVSTVGAGTYSFDTASGAWRKEGNWALPFRGRAEYIPEHNLWFGFTPNDLQLCTSDLTASSEVRPPMLQNVWRDVVRPKNWTLRDASLLPLGSGKVCITRFFLTCVEENFEDMSGYTHDERENFAVLEGVQLWKAGESDCIGELRMVQHKSDRYIFGHGLGIPL